MSNFLETLHGTPKDIVFPGIFEMTTEPAPIIAPLPTSILFIKDEPVPIEQSLPNLIVPAKLHPGLISTKSPTVPS